LRKPATATGLRQATIKGITKPNKMVGTLVSLAAKYMFAEPMYWAVASQAMRTSDSTDAVV
jgi:hypothetical protein